MTKTFFAAAVLAGSMLIAGSAGAASLSVTSGAVHTPGSNISDVQYRSRTVVTRHRGPECHVRVVRTRMGHRVVVKRVRVCR